MGSGGAQSLWSPSYEAGAKRFKIDTPYFVAEYILHMVTPFSAAIDGGTLNA